LTTDNNIDHIKHSIEAGTAVVVSDRSFLNTHDAGTAGWILEDENNSQQVRGSLLECPEQRILNVHTEVN
jgi:hypothetical protein